MQMIEKGDIVRRKDGKPLWYKSLEGVIEEVLPHNEFYVKTIDEEYGIQNVTPVDLAYIEKVEEQNG